MTTLKRINGIHIVTIDGKEHTFETFRDALIFIASTKNRNG